MKKPKVSRICTRQHHSAQLNAFSASRETAAIGKLLILTDHFTLIKLSILSETNPLQINPTWSGFINVDMTLLRQFARILESILISDITEMASTNFSLHEY